MTFIPESIKPYLWDTPLENISFEKHYRFIIERVLEYGDAEAINWLNSTFLNEQIVEVLTKSKRISPKTGSFYASMYDVDPQTLQCLKKPFTQKQNRF